MKSIQLAEKISELVFNKKGFDVMILDLRKVAAFADYFVICSADSDTQVKAIADEIDHSLRENGIKYWHREGYQALNWVLLDYVDVVAHVFKKDSREFYGLERLWGDAPVIEVEDPMLKRKKAPAKKKPGRPKKTKSE